MTTPDHTLTDAERRLLLRCPKCSHYASLHGADDGCGGARPPDDCGCPESFSAVVYSSVETIVAARLAALATVRADAGRDALLAAADAAEALWRRWATNTGPESPTAAWLRARAEAVGDDHA